VSGDARKDFTETIKNLEGCLKEAEKYWSRS